MIAIKAGIPEDCLQDEYCNENDNEEAFHKFFVENVAKRVPSLKNMSIDVLKGEWQWSFEILNNISGSLDELTLIVSSREELSMGTSNDDSDFEELSGLIQHSPNLKRLTLSITWKYRLFNISSNSLEHIDMTDSNEGYFLDKCVCPSLKTLKCNYNAFYTKVYNDLKPHLPLSNEEALARLNQQIGHYPTVNVQAGENSFDELVAPDSCRVMIVRRPWHRYYSPYYERHERDTLDWRSLWSHFFSAAASPHIPQCVLIPVQLLCIVGICWTVSLLL